MSILPYCTFYGFLYTSNVATLEDTILYNSFLALNTHMETVYGKYFFSFLFFLSLRNRPKAILRKLFSSNLVKRPATSLNALLTLKF